MQQYLLTFGDLLGGSPAAHLFWSLIGLRKYAAHAAENPFLVGGQLQKRVTRFAIFLRLDRKDFCAQRSGFKVLYEGRLPSAPRLCLWQFIRGARFQESFLDKLI
jgi:hypothetical protein